MQLSSCAQKRKDIPLPVILPDVRHLRARIRNTLAGDLALASGDALLIFAVARSAAGFYIGTAASSGDMHRASAEYWRHQEDAEQALETGCWTLRHDPLLSV